MPEPGKQQRYEWRRRQPPIVKHFDIVPDPRSHLNQIGDNKAERKWQVEQQDVFLDEIVFAAPQDRRHEQRNEQSGVLEPKPDRVFVMSVPTKLPGEETASIYCRVGGGPPQLW